MDDWFHFQQFSVRHQGASMKVGTDSVLLGAWAFLSNAMSILDIGTGTGLLALMMAQRTPAHVTVDGVELLEAESLLGKENTSRSPWKDRIGIHHVPIQSFDPGWNYDLIITNPPFFNNSLKPPDENRKHARHSDTLKADELIDAVLRLLHPSGTFNLILPCPEGRELINLAERKGLYCTRHWTFRARADKPEERYLLEFSRAIPVEVDRGEIVLYSHGNEWTPGYKKLVEKFYLER